MNGEKRDHHYLSTQAEKFRQLAWDTPDKRASQELLALADELQEEAKLLRTQKSSMDNQG
jgi:hypothetical protein